MIKKDHEGHFWSKVAKAWQDECWLWQGGRNAGGYGLYQVPGSPKLFLAHRAAYFFHAEINPGKKVICHKCDNPPCVNPNHLFMGTQQDNMRDCAKKGRAGRNKGSKVTRIRNELSEDFFRLRDLEREIAAEAKALLKKIEKEFS